MGVTFLTNEDEKLFVKSVNGVLPDSKTGDVFIEFDSPGSNDDLVQRVEDIENALSELSLADEEEF